MELSDPIIRARSRREVMDWGLVLASQNIEATIVQFEDGWGLAVHELDYAHAQVALEQYRLENRGWSWRRRLPGSGLVFHAGAGIWVATMVIFYFWSTVQFPGAKEAGMVDSSPGLRGEWWRLFTAQTLHADLSHLFANLTTGFLLMGMAMARYGAGVTILACYAAGAAGNELSLLLYPGLHRSLGASGMVMGALGLLAVQSLSLWRKFRPAPIIFWRAGAAAVLFLTLVGFSPGTDMVAHVAGFVAGASIGAALNLTRPSNLQRGGVNTVTVFLATALLIATWWLAIRQR